MNNLIDLLYIIPPENNYMINTENHKTYNYTICHITLI